MIYDRLVYKPNLGLNVIIGPNGSGKSSISAALCLGLNGTPKSTGREKSAVDYIKMGCDECIIVTTLYGTSTNRSMKVKRQIKRGDGTAGSSKFWMATAISRRTLYVSKPWRLFMSGRPFTRCTSYLIIFA